MLVQLKIEEAMYSQEHSYASCFHQNNSNCHASKPIHDQPNLKPIIENINCHNPHETSCDTCNIPIFNKLYYLF